MSIRFFALVFSVIFAPLVCAQAKPATPEASVQVSGLKALPQFPPSSTVMQTALNDFYHCIDNTVASTTQTKTATADTVITQCAASQEQLQRMLPPDAYNQGMTGARQRITSGLVARQAAITADQ
jgi:hypothetical protein